MPRVCTVCAHGRRAEIEAALAVGESQREVAGRFAVSKTSLVRHADHLASRAPSAAPAQPEKRTGTANPAADAPAKRTGAEPRKRTTPTAVERVADERRAFELRLAGKTYPEIADEIGCSPATAYDLVDAGLTRTRGTTDELAAKLRDLEVARCDAIIASFWERATDATNAWGEGPAERTVYSAAQDKAAQTLLKAMERRAKLLGLDLCDSATVQVTIVQHPTFHAVTRAIFDALRPFPDARAAVMARMRAAVSADRAEAQLTGG
jgi:transposase